jgi:hypothetical protein
MTLDGTDFLEYGLVAIKAQGAYDMPSRIPPFYYDWGDEFEILLGPSWKAFEPRLVAVDFLYDQRRQSIGTPGPSYLDEFTRNYLEAIDHSLVMTDAAGGMGSLVVKIDSASGHTRYRSGNQRIKLLFRERVPSFPGTVPGTKAGGPVSIDGYGLSQFSATLVKATGLSDLAELKQSNDTVHLAAPKRQRYRNLQTFTLSLAIRDDNPYTRLASLQKVLSSDQVLPFTISGLSFDTFLAQGFPVQKLDNKTLKFDLKLVRL